MALTIRIFGYSGDPSGAEDKTIRFAVRDNTKIRANQRIGQLKANLAVLSVDAGPSPRRVLALSSSTQPDIRLIVIDELQVGGLLYVWFVAWGVKQHHAIDTDDLTVTIETVNTTIVSGTASDVSLATP